MGYELHEGAVVNCRLPVFELENLVAQQILQLVTIGVLMCIDQQCHQAMVGADVLLLVRETFPDQTRCDDRVVIDVFSLVHRYAPLGEYSHIIDKAEPFFKHNEKPLTGALGTGRYEGPRKGRAVQSADSGRRVGRVVVDAQHHRQVAQHLNAARSHVELGVLADVLPGVTSIDHRTQAGGVERTIRRCAELDDAVRAVGAVRQGDELGQVGSQEAPVAACSVVGRQQRCHGVDYLIGQPDLVERQAAAGILADGCVRNRDDLGRLRVAQKPLDQLLVSSAIQGDLDVLRWAGLGCQPSGAPSGMLDDYHQFHHFAGHGGAFLG